MIGWSQLELTQSKRQKTCQGDHRLAYNQNMTKNSHRTLRHHNQQGSGSRQGKSINKWLLPPQNIMAYRNSMPFNWLTYGQMDSNIIPAIKRRPRIIHFSCAPKYLPLRMEIFLKCEPHFARGNHSHTHARQQSLMIHPFIVGVKMSQTSWYLLIDPNVIKGRHALEFCGHWSMHVLWIEIHLSSNCDTD